MDDRNINPISSDYDSSWDVLSAEVQRSTKGRRISRLKSSAYIVLLVFLLAGFFLFLYSQIERQKVELETLMASEASTRQEQVSKAQQEILKTRENAFDTVRRLANSQQIVNLLIRERFDSLKKTNAHQLALKSDQKALRDSIKRLWALIDHSNTTYQSQIASLSSNLQRLADNKADKVEVQLIRDSTYSLAARIKKEVDDKAASALVINLSKQVSLKADKSALRNYATLDSYRQMTKALQDRLDSINKLVIKMEGSKNSPRLP